MLKLDKNKKYLLACSFGPDSMSLFHMLLKEGYDFAVAHVNYHLRVESRLETKGLEDYCFKNHVKLFVLHSFHQFKSNVEGNCREIRYNFFKDYMPYFDELLIAHNEDDLIETFLLQKERKNIPVYYGLQEESFLNGYLVKRPLLKKTKKELLNYCIRNKVPFAIDSSNLTDAYKRNVIRHSIVENMNDLDRNAVVHDINLANKKIKALRDKLSHLEDGKISSLTKLNAEEINILLYDKAKQSCPDFNLSLGNSKRILEAAKSNKPNIHIKFRDNLYFVKEYDHYYFMNSLYFPGFKYILNKPSTMINEFFYLDFSKDASNRNVKESDYPLTIRTYENGDTTKINGYKVPIKRLFIDWKMPESVRKRWPLIINKDGEVIYVPRYRETFKITPDLNFYVKMAFSCK